jgi:hypothetical protein
MQFFTTSPKEPSMETFRRETEENAQSDAKEREVGRPQVSPKEPEKPRQRERPRPV